jgi:hypothetical protein
MNFVAPIFVLLAPFGLIYGWVCYFTPASNEIRGWRNRATLVSLTLTSVVLLLWPVMMALMPAADWRSGAEMGHQVQWVGLRVKVAFRVLLTALILGLLGRPRLILPLVVGCTGTGLLWLFTALMD